jgi:hypothetical protein
VAKEDDMIRRRRARNVVEAAVVAGSVVALVATQPTAARARGETPLTPRYASVATLTTRDFRVALGAYRVDREATPSADVRLAVARRVGSSWRESGETPLRQTYFWHAVTGPRALCRLEISTGGSQQSFRPHVTVQLLLSPSLGCARTHRVPLPTG